MVRERPPGDPAKGPQARGVRGATRGTWCEVWSSPNVLSLSKGASRKAKGEVEAANEARDEPAAGSEPDMFGEAGSVAAE